MAEKAAEATPVSSSLAPDSASAAMVVRSAELEGVAGDITMMDSDGKSAAEAVADKGRSEAVDDKPTEAGTDRSKGSEASKGSEVSKGSEAGAKTKKPSPRPDDVEMKDADDAAATATTTAAAATAKAEDKLDTPATPATPAASAVPAEAAPESIIVASTSTPTPLAGRGRGGPRRSIGSAAKTLNRKASKRALTNAQVKPGDHFLVKLKGYPAWPVIVCDQSMLPDTLIRSRPLAAARADGTFAEPYTDGGKRVHDRNYPVMYLHTNEFGWVLNTNLQDLSLEKAAELVKEHMRKDLKAAFELAIEQHELQYYKDMLDHHAKETAELELELEAKKAAAAAAPRKAKNKSKSATSDDDHEDSLDMDHQSGLAAADDAGQADEEAGDGSKSTKAKTTLLSSAGKLKKRKAEDNQTPPQRADSVKKAKIIKVVASSSATPKSANGVAASEQPESKLAKPKKAGSSPHPVEVSDEVSDEAQAEKKKREVLYLRHKLQRGLLMKDADPKEEEMKPMSDFLAKLEAYQDLDPVVIRETKINKVLKAILKIDDIPKEAELLFKARSQALLDKWGKIMTAETGTSGAGAAAALQQPPPPPPPLASNGVNGASEEPDKDRDKSLERGGGHDDHDDGSNDQGHGGGSRTPVNGSSEKHKMKGKEVEPAGQKAPNPANDEADKKKIKTDEDQSVGKEAAAEKVGGHVLSA